MVQGPHQDNYPTSNLPPTSALWAPKDYLLDWRQLLCVRRHFPDRMRTPAGNSGPSCTHANVQQVRTSGGE